MSDALRDKLTSEILPADGPDLARHVDRVLLVRGIDLVDVAIAIATDDTARVGGWLKSGALTRPEPGDLAPHDFEILVVQPFVVARVVLKPAAEA